MKDCKDQAECNSFLTENGLNSHPYEAEIMALLQNPHPGIELSAESVGLEMNDSYVWVDTEMQLKELVNVLSKKRFFGVDTEQHSLRTFLGFTALVQVVLCYPLNFFVCIVPVIYFLINLLMIRVSFLFCRADFYKTERLFD